MGELLDRTVSRTNLARQPPSGGDRSVRFHNLRSAVAGDIQYELMRVRLGDGEETTVYLVRHPLASTHVRAVHFPEPTRLDHWCAAQGHPEAMVGGFFVRDPYRPLGELRLRGRPIAHEPIPEPWGPRRACVHLHDGVRIAHREQLGADPPGDLLQAGPLLVSEGRPVAIADDHEGFSGGAAQFDSDITVGRYPRCALGIGQDELLAVCCDGRRSGVDGGLDLAQLGRLLISFGAGQAINLDGGGSATLVHRGHLLNRPYSSHHQPAPESRPVVTALVFAAGG